MSKNKPKGTPLWICNYGVKHRMTEECECKNTFGFHFNLLEYCQKTFGIEWTHQITEHMRNDFLRVQSLS